MSDDLKSTTGSVDTAPAAGKNKNTTLIIVIVVLVVLCCICISLMGLLIAFIDPIMQYLQSLGL